MINTIFIERRVESLDGSRIRIKVQIRHAIQGLIECYPKTKEELLKCIEQNVDENTFKGVGM